MAITNLLVGYPAILSTERSLSMIICTVYFENKILFKLVRMLDW